jgi:hypothetical protein
MTSASGPFESARIKNSDVSFARLNRSRALEATDSLAHTRAPNTQDHRHRLVSHSELIAISAGMRHY